MAYFGAVYFAFSCIHIAIFVNELYIVICTVHHVFHYFMLGARVFTDFYKERQLVIVFKDVKQSLPL